MLRLTIRGLLARSGRLALTAVAIVIGVGFVAASLVITDTVAAGFEQGTGSRQFDLVVRPAQGEEGEPQAARRSATVTADTVSAAAGVPGVRAADGALHELGFLTPFNAAREVSGEEVTLEVRSLPETDALAAQLPLQKGRLPARDGELLLDGGTATRSGLDVGDVVDLLVFPSGDSATMTLTSEEMTVVGVVEAGGTGMSTLAFSSGSNTAFVTTATAQRLMYSEQRFAQVNVLLDEDADAAAVRDALSVAVGSGLEVRTVDEVVAENRALARDELRFFLAVLLGFASVALLVGGMLIANSLSVVVAQRTRELSLLRCVGASRTQVLRQVLGEALLLGAVASTVGAVLGVAGGAGLYRLLGELVVTDGDTGLAVTARAVWAPVLVGVVTTLLAALVPVTRATRVAPVAALRAADGTGASRHRWIRPLVVVLAAGAALVLLAVGTGGTGNLWLTAAGVLAALVGVFAVLPLATSLLFRAVAVLTRRTAPAGLAMAARNAARTPGRTAATAAALLVGVMLVTFTTVLADSVKTGITASVERAVAADYQLLALDVEGVSERTLRTVEEDAALGTSAREITVRGQVGDETRDVVAVDAAWTRLLRPETTAGSAESLRDGRMLLPAGLAQQQGLTVGDDVRVDLGESGERTLTVGGIVADDGLQPGWGAPVVPLDRFGADLGDEPVSALWAARAPGVTPEDGRTSVERAIGDDELVFVQDRSELVAEFAALVNIVLAAVNMLLALAVVIGVLGVANTLALSVAERTRELGLLRAVGASRSQVRRLVRWEALLVSAVGAVVGVMVGTGAAWAVTAALQAGGQTLLVFSPQLPVLLAYTAIALVAGVAAAVLPAVRAARVHPLRAVAAP